MSTIEQDPNAIFEKAMFNLLRSFNYIDLNVGLLIATTPGQGSSEDLYKKLSKKSFDQKMKWFNLLLNESALSEHIGEQGVSEFKEWYSSAHEARELRNRFVHSIWRFNPMNRGSPVEISSPPWMKEALGDKCCEYMSLGELEARASMVENSFQAFQKIREKYHV